MTEIALILVAALIAWLVFDGLRAREAAIREAKDACRAQHVQFLDDTVRRVHTRIVRNERGTAVLQRTFVFEFSEDGTSRRGGTVVMRGDEPETTELDPYRIG
ncbi:MAG: DUF3301 domain-containing protein [Casimicrobiaceae bacterium]